MNNYKEEELYEKIAEVVHLICNNPAIYFSETDIHVLMMKALMEIDCFNPFADWKKGLRSTNCTIGKKSMKAKAPSKEKYRTMLVHREYGNNKGTGERSDLVIFDEEEVKSIDDPINLKKNKGKEYLTPKYIFEFGTEKCDDYKEHVEGDLKKLSERKSTGFLIHIQRIYIKSGNVTSAFKDNRSMNKKNQDATIKLWEGTKSKNKIKILVFFVLVGGDKIFIEEKVQMFNPYSTNGDEHWVALNLAKIKGIIRIFLKEKNPNLVEIKKIVMQK